jgi:hypothetical protein
MVADLMTADAVPLMEDDPQIIAWRGGVRTEIEDLEPEDWFRMLNQAEGARRRERCARRHRVVAVLVRVSAR